MRSIKQKYKKQKLNILQVHNFYMQPGGEDVVAQNEADMLTGHGHHVYRYLRHNAEIMDLSVLEKLFLPIDSVFSIRTYLDVRRLIRKHDIDVVHVHNTLHRISSSVFFAAKVEKVPVVMTAHNYRLCCPNGMFYCNKKVCEACVNGSLCNAVLHKCYRNSYMQSLGIAFSTWAHRILHTYRGVHIICLTEFQKQKLAMLPDVLPQNLHIKPNFIEHKLPGANRRNMILFAGRLDENKGILDLLKAFRRVSMQLKKSGDAIPELLVCGDGELFDSCNRYIQKHHMEHVRLLGYVPHDDVLQYMAEAKCLVIPSKWYEGMPMALTEAYHLQTPVIAPNHGAFTKLVTDGINGYKYEPGNRKAFVSLLHRMAVDSADVSCDFSTQKVYEKSQYEANYKRLIQIYERSIRSNERILNNVWNYQEK